MSVKPPISLWPDPDALGASSLEVTIFGPVLGSMDSPTITVDEACTVDGVDLTAWIVRSAAYNGTAAKNVLWRPKLTILIVTRQPAVVLRTIWKMRLTTGVLLNHAETPGYSSQAYPIEMTEVLRSGSQDRGKN